MAGSDILFKVILRYASGVMGSMINASSPNSLAFKKLAGTSFNLAEKDRYSYRSVLSGMKDVVRLPLKKDMPQASEAQVVYDVAPDTREDRVAYLKFYGVQGPFDFVGSGDLLYFRSLPDKALFLLLTLPVQLHLLLYGLVKKDKSGLHAVLKNILITRNFLLYSASRLGSRIFMFSIYDTNSAFFSLCCMSAGLSVSQVTSEVPLYKWNQVIIANELILCTGYQELEVKRFKETILFDSLKIFGPETYYKIAGKYTQAPLKNSRIGFYSTGGWVRKKMGHIDQGTDLEFFEAKILKDLDGMLSGPGKPELVIYPHPREKSFYNHSKEALYDHYRKMIPSASFSIYHGKEPSNLLFDEVYIAVCYMTTLIFERAFAGRKSVIAYFKEPGFPIQKHFGCLDVVDNEKELEKIIGLNY